MSHPLVERTLAARSIIRPTNFDVVDAFADKMKSANFDLGIGKDFIFALTGVSFGLYHREGTSSLITSVL